MMAPSMKETHEIKGVHIWLSKEHEKGEREESERERQRGKAKKSHETILFFLDYSLDYSLDDDHGDTLAIERLCRASKFT